MAAYETLHSSHQENIKPRGQRRFSETFALFLWVITVTKQSMALRVDVRFIDESDFVNKRRAFIVKDNPDWEIGSSISRIWLIYQTSRKN